MNNFMDDLKGILSSLVILILLSSGIFADFVNFMLWLFMLQNAQPTTSLAGGIIVRILTFVVSYELVGVIFDWIGLYNSKIMSWFYHVISILVGFVLAYIVYTIEQYILIIGIVLGVLFVGLAIYFIIAFINSKKPKKSKKAYED